MDFLEGTWSGYWGSKWSKSIMATSPEGHRGPNTGHPTTFAWKVSRTSPGGVKQNFQ